MEAFPSPFVLGSSESGAQGIMPDPEPTTLQMLALAIIFVFPAIAMVVLLIRVAGRFATRQFGWDDWLICVAMLFSIAETVFSFFCKSTFRPSSARPPHLERSYYQLFGDNFQLTLGAVIKTNFVGIPTSKVPMDRDPTEAMIWGYVVQIPYNIILALVKSSVLIFLLRLFGQKKGVRRYVIILNTLTIAQMIAVFFAITFQCTPIQFNWDPTIANGRCVDRRALFTFTSAFHITTDLLVLALPIWIFADLKIPRRAKIGLLFVFLLGFLVTIASIARLVIFVQGLFNLAPNSDPSANIGFVVSAIETNLALITASAPALRPIFRSRDRGGWIGRSSVAPSKMGPDLEAGQKTLGWPTDSNAQADTTSGVARKFGRGGSRSGRRGGRGRGGTKKYDIRIRRPNTELAELRSQSPRSSEEETMTPNGIMRVSDIQREIDGIVKEIAVSGSGTYTGLERIPYQASRGGDKAATRAGSKVARSNSSSNKATTNAEPYVAYLGRNNTTGGNYTSKQNHSSFYSSTTAALGIRESGIIKRDSNINNFRNTGFEFFNGNGAANNARGEDIYSGTRRNNPQRYYSESVYPDAEYVNTHSRDYSEERISRYGEKRFGVVTPKATKPPARPWENDAGLPF